MKSKKPTGDSREGNEDFKGKRKPRLTPIKKQKSKRTQFLDEIEEFENEEFNFRAEDLEDLYKDMEGIDDDDDY